MHQAEVVAGLLLVADAQLAEAVVPAVRPLDDPAPRGVALLLGGRRGRVRPLATFLGGVDDIAARLGRLARFGEVKAFVPAQVLRRAGGGSRARHHDVVQGRLGHLHVVAVGCADDRA